MSVFYDAGLLFESSASGTPHRQGEFLGTLFLLLSASFCTGVISILQDLTAVSGRHTHTLGQGCQTPFGSGTTYSTV